MLQIVPRALFKKSSWPPGGLIATGAYQMGKGVYLNDMPPHQHTKAEVVHNNYDGELHVHVYIVCTCI